MYRGSSSRSRHGESAVMVVAPSPGHAFGPAVGGGGAGWSEVPGDAGGVDVGGEVAVVDEGVVSAAEQRAVPDVGRA